MDKSSLAAKRRQDKSHKKVPPPKPAKQKGKPKEPDVQHTAPLVVCDDRYGKRQLQQNWTEERDLPASGSDTEDEQLQAADFEKLLELPPSSGGHFLLSTEKHWLQPSTNLPGEDKHNRYSEYFRIDTKLLNASLGCIPFYERHGYDEALFSTLELNLMRQKAEQQTNKYLQNFADQLGGKLGSVSRESKQNMSSPRKPQPPPCLIGKFAKPKDMLADTTVVKSPEAKSTQSTASVPVVQPVEAKMDELKIDAEASKPVSVTKPVVDPGFQNTTIPKPVTSSTNDTKEDIQQWLDDILDI